VDSSNTFSIESSSLADPFEAPSESKPKDSSKVQLKGHKHHKKHKKHKKVEEEEDEDSKIPDMVQISQIRDVDNNEMYGDRA